MVGGNSGDRKKWTNSGHNLKGESTGWGRIERNRGQVPHVDLEWPGESGCSLLKSGSLGRGGGDLQGVVWRGQTQTSILAGLSLGCQISYRPYDRRVCDRAQVGDTDRGIIEP